LFWADSPKGTYTDDMTRDEYGKAYQRGFDLTVRLLLSRGAPRDRAREVAQAAWVRGWERLSQLRNEELVVTWVNTIALNVYRSVLRSEPAYQALPELSTKAGVNLAAIDVARILKICRPCDRLLLEQQMRGVTAEEIARTQGVSETAIRIRLLRARRAARSRVEKRAARIQEGRGALMAGCDAAA
jgi:DNA-directed RNA polymerase specialized sigma24 family protein